MSETKNQAVENLLSSQQQEVVGLDETLRGFSYNLWGHGTPSTDPESFFGEGVKVSSYPNIFQYALPVDSSNVTEIDDWPHKRDPSRPTNVVLLAIPYASPEDGVTFSGVVAEQIFDQDAQVLPPEFVVGFYDASAKSVIINPDFNLDDKSHQVISAKMKAKYEKEKAEIANRLLLDENQERPDLAMPVPIAPVDTSKNAPVVW